jgi:hypothetical protein
MLAESVSGKSKDNSRAFADKVDMLKRANFINYSYKKVFY